MTSHHDHQALHDRLEATRRELEDERDGAERLKREANSRFEQDRTNINKLKEELSKYKTRLEEAKARTEEEINKLEQRIEEVKTERDNCQSEAENLKIQLQLCENKSEGVSNQLHETLRKLKEANVVLPLSRHYKARNLYGIHAAANVFKVTSDFHKHQRTINSGYNEQTINKILNQKLHKKALKLVFAPPEKKPSSFCSITYTGKISIKIDKHIKKKGITPAIRTNNNLGTYIKNKNQNKKYLHSGVYKLKCGDSPKTYIGQTGRTFNKCIAEHKRAFNNRKTDYTYALHLQDHNHSFHDEFQILHIQNKSYLY
ncbi:unnamed protein product [Diabrotica balteata]|uniref:GIY-YIG domain-containing protein n=1 Tax=Diabrotica balteata TaxID=107213 RepID=A0A9N9SNN8_DIABA|nr:unnamed protein product [Diabrotica balteata]